MSERSCVDCRWAAWQKTRSGRIRKGFYIHHCIYEIKVPRKVPKAAVDALVSFRNRINWIDNEHPYTDCQTYERKETDANG